MNKKEREAIKKAISVVSSCLTLEQLKSAENFCYLIAKDLTKYDQWAMLNRMVFIKRMEPFLIIKRKALL